MLWEFPLNYILKMHVDRFNHLIIFCKYLRESFDGNLANLSAFSVLQISQGLVELGLVMAGQRNSVKIPVCRENKRRSLLNKAGMKGRLGGSIG